MSGSIESVASFQTFTSLNWKIEDTFFLPLGRVIVLYFFLFRTIISKARGEIAATFNPI